MARILRYSTLGTSMGFLPSADPNVTRAPTSSHVAKPPPFSPPTYSIWVNSLWFLSFALSLICALLAMSIQLWVCRYISFTRPAPGRCSQKKRARIRATFFDNMNGSIPSGIIDSLRTRTPLTAPTRTGWSVQINWGEPASAHRGPSIRTHPPS